MKTFQDRLPLPPLSLLGIGYGCFGLLLGLHRASWWAWLVAWLGSISWVLDESFTWFVSLVGASATIFGAGMALWTLVVPGSIVSILLICLTVIGWSLRDAVRDSLWVGMIVIAAIAAANWLFVGVHGGTVILSGKFPFAFLLATGIICSGLGALAWMQMQSKGFNAPQIVFIFGSTTALGLACGGLLGLSLSIVGS